MKTKHQDYEEYTELGRKFIQRWNKMDRDGAQNIISEEFNISIPTVYRIRKKLGLKHLHDPKHPGRKALYKRIRKLYHKHESTSKVGMIVGMSSQNINKILRKQNVKINPPYLTNILLMPSHNGMPTTKLNKTIKKLYLEEGMTGKEISEALNCNHNSIVARLRAMGISPKQNHQHVHGGYPCLWCNTIMDKVWVARGKRKQKYCCSSCKNKVKDYRRYLDAERRIKLFEEELKQNHGDSWKEAKERILLRENKGNQKYCLNEKLII